MKTQNALIRAYHKVSLVQQIGIGLLAGVALGFFVPESSGYVKIFGDLFINALKSVAPVLVLVLVMASIANHQAGKQSNMKQLVILYLVGMFAASIVAVAASFLFPTHLGKLEGVSNMDTTAPSSVQEVLLILVGKMVDNPVNGIVDANYIGLIVWGIALGLALRHASSTTKVMINDLSSSIMFVVKIVIRFAPLGVFGLVAATIGETGVSQLSSYLHLVVVLLACMAIIALIINPLIAFLICKKNPYPLILIALKESGVPAFFTRSSAANIPVNIEISKKYGFDEDIYSVAVPLGATINMSGAAITITILTLATVHTLGIEVTIFSALLLSVIASVCACGASGVAGGSLLLIPVACSMFNISNDVAMQVVAIGVMIGVVQDSVETAVNSSTDIVFIGAISEAKKGITIYTQTLQNE